MRVWDVPPEELCTRHLVGEHSEIHAVWSVIQNGKHGFAAHPEVNRWRGNLAALRLRHEAVCSEMKNRGYRHSSPVAHVQEGDISEPVQLLVSVDTQREILRSKPCPCGTSIRL